MGIGGNVFSYQDYDGKTSCKDIYNWICRKWFDFSGCKYGIRCKRSGCGCSSSRIDELCMSFNAKEHH